MHHPHEMLDRLEEVFRDLHKLDAETGKPVAALDRLASTIFAKADMNPDASFLNACFLGAYAENNDLFERLLVELLRDHIYWRRNFHPDDPPPIPAFAQQDAAYIDFVSRLRHELQ
ncbi:hypothetical protein B2A_09961, partial [mine drainage metagenome]